MVGLGLPFECFRVVGSMEPWLSKRGDRCVHVECVANLVCKSCFVLPERLHINTLLDGVEGVVKDDMELRRDMTSLGIQNQGNQVGMLVRLAKVDAHSGSLRPLLLAFDRALKRSI